MNRIVHISASDKFRAARGINGVGWVDAPDREGTDPERIGEKEVEDHPTAQLRTFQPEYGAVG